MKCHVCGAEYTPRKSEHYISRGVQQTGLTVIVGEKEPKQFDTFDCPVCGCQIVAGERNRRVNTSADEVETKED